MKTATLSALALMGASGLVPSAAHAEARGRFALRLEAGVGAMVSSFQRDALDYGLGLSGALRGAVHLAAPLSVQVSGVYRLYRSDQGYGYVSGATLGLRFEPVRGATTVFVDANAGPHQTGGDWRFGYDVGAGVEFALGSTLRLGPMLRFQHVVPTSADLPEDALAAVVGLSVTLQRRHLEAPPPPPEPEAPTPQAPPPSDRDHDGVLDGDDLCPDQAAGDHPDAQRRGCPTPDSDSDGVLDSDDQCPSTHAGAHPDPSRAGCPDGDNDADGVLNHDDQCPSEPRGLSADAARPGCPAPDRDGDTVPDATDACPTRAGAPAADPRRNGCPGLVTVAGGLIRINRPVFFGSDSDEILPTSDAVLTAVAETLRLAPQIRRVMVEGHTDSQGNPDHNMDLSQRRAASVVRWLSAHGVEAERLASSGLGQTRPLRPNITARNRAMNRRVEFHVLDPAPAAAPATPAPTGRARRRR
jgi:outer membrane protein OmpA-like peptidoglycan-associated protein/opacity protein-like surface antigen